MARHPDPDRPNEPGDYLLNVGADTARASLPGVQQAIARLMAERAPYQPGTPIRTAYYKAIDALHDLEDLLHQAIMDAPAPDDPDPEIDNGPAC